VTGNLTGNVTGNISGTAPAGSLTGTTLASNVVTSSLTALGTIATGVWQGTAIADTYLATISTAGKIASSAAVTGLDAALALKAPLADPTFTGTVTLPILVGSDTTDSSSSTTGAFKTAGGLGVAKALFVGGNFTIGSTAGRNLITHFDYTELKSSTIAKASTLYFESAATGNGAVGATGTSATDVWGTSGKANYAFLQGASGVQFIGNATEGGFMTAAGAWTLGPVGGTYTTSPVVIGSSTTTSGSYALITMSSTAASRNSIEWYSASTLKGRIGSDNPGNNLITNSSAGDFCIVSNSQNILFSGDNGNTIHGKMTSAGAWTLGASGSAAYFPGTRTNTGAAVVGTPNSQSKSLPSNSSTATFDLSTTGFQTTGGGALCFVTEGAANNSVLFFVAGNGATTTITIISQTAAGYYVVGAPGAANKIGITHTNGTTAALLLTAGSSGFAATSVWLTCLTNAAGA
jgi:hypothetical protein